MSKAEWILELVNPYLKNIVTYTTSLSAILVGCGLLIAGLNICILVYNAIFNTDILEIDPLHGLYQHIDERRTPPIMTKIRYKLGSLEFLFYDDLYSLIYR